jgi:hypothetical protein
MAYVKGTYAGNYGTGRPGSGGYNAPTPTSPNIFDNIGSYISNAAGGIFNQAPTGPVDLDLGGTNVAPVVNWNPTTGPVGNAPTTSPTFNFPDTPDNSVTSSFNVRGYDNAGNLLPGWELGLDNVPYNTALFDLNDDAIANTTGGTSGGVGGTTTSTSLLTPQTFEQRTGTPYVPPEFSEPVPYEYGAKPYIYGEGLNTAGDAYDIWGTPVGAPNPYYEGQRGLFGSTSGDVSIDPILPVEEEPVITGPADGAINMDPITMPDGVPGANLSPKIGAVNPVTGQTTPIQPWQQVGGVTPLPHGGGTGPGGQDLTYQETIDYFGLTPQSTTFPSPPGANPSLFDRQLAEMSPEQIERMNQTLADENRMQQGQIGFDFDKQKGVPEGIINAGGGGRMVVPWVNTKTGQTWDAPHTGFSAASGGDWTPAAGNKGILDGEVRGNIFEQPGDRLGSGGRGTAFEQPGDREALTPEEFDTGRNKLLEAWQKQMQDTSKNIASNEQRKQTFDASPPYPLGLFQDIVDASDGELQIINDNGKYHLAPNPYGGLLGTEGNTEEYTLDNDNTNFEEQWTAGQGLDDLMKKGTDLQNRFDAQEQVQTDKQDVIDKRQAKSDARIAKADAERKAAMKVLNRKKAAEAQKLVNEQKAAAAEAKKAEQKSALDFKAAADKKKLERIEAAEAETKRKNVEAKEAKLKAERDKRQAESNARIAKAEAKRKADMKALKFKAAADAQKAKNEAAKKAKEEAAKKAAALKEERNRRQRESDARAAKAEAKRKADMAALNRKKAADARKKAADAAAKKAADEAAMKRREDARRPTYTPKPKPKPKPRPPINRPKPPTRRRKVVVKNWGGR